jgi:hypothetical protein
MSPRPERVAPIPRRDPKHGLVPAHPGGLFLSIPMNGENHSYEEGLREGRINHLERVVVDLSQNFKDSHESHEKRLRYLEGIAASMLAIIAFTTVLPAVVSFLGTLASK